MQPLNEKQAQSVWSRVMQTHPATEQTAEGLPEQLKAFQAAEDAAAATLKLLACRVGRNAALRLHPMAQQARCRANRWRTLYFLLTGQKMQPEKCRCEAEGNRCSLLRSCCEAAQLAEKNYTRAADRYPDYAPLFLQAAQEAACQTRSLFLILQQYIR